MASRDETRLVSAVVFDRVYKMNIDLLVVGRCFPVLSLVDEGVVFIDLSQLEFRAILPLRVPFSSSILMACA